MTTAPAGAFRPLVMQASDPERIVGGVLVSEPEEGKAIVPCLFALRPAFRSQAACQALLARAEDVARELGAHTLAFAFHDDSPDVSWLKSRGAVVFKESVFFEGDGFAFRERIAPILKRLESRAHRFAVRPLREEDHPEIASILATHGLMDEARARKQLAERYDPDLCLVSTEQDRIAGAMLTLPAPDGRLHFENRIVAPDFMAASSLINLGLMDAIGTRGLAAGFTSFLFSCQPDKDRETMNFARRCGCRQARRQLILHLPLSSRSG